MGQDTIDQLFQLVLIPLMVILTRFIIKWLNAKSAVMQAQTDNEVAQKYISMLTQTITECVLATNQTYVDNLKKQNKFDAAAQEVAFQLTSEAVMEILSEDAKEYLTEMFGDLEKYVSSKIEAEVKLRKTA